MEWWRELQSTRVCEETNVRQEMTKMKGGFPANRCPVCGSNDELLVSETPANRLYKCRDCSVSHVWPIPSVEELNLRFNRFYSARIAHVHEMFERNRDKVLARLARYIHGHSRPGRILDIGCGSGYFLGRFFDPAVWARFGIEVSEENSAEAVAQGLTVITTDLAGSHLPAESFEAIIVLDTFFYFPDPCAAAREMYRLLVPGGDRGSGGSAGRDAFVPAVKQSGPAGSVLLLPEVSEETIRGRRVFRETCSAAAAEPPADSVEAAGLFDLCGRHVHNLAVVLRAARCFAAVCSCGIEAVDPRLLARAGESYLLGRAGRIVGDGKRSRI